MLQHGNLCKHTAALQDAGKLSLRTVLMDTSLYILRKQMLCKYFEASPTCESMRQAIHS